MTQREDVRAAEKAVKGFLELYGQGMVDDRSGPWVRACAVASGIYTRLYAASIAKDPDKARYHRQLADGLLDELLQKAQHDPIQRGAVGRLAESLSDEGLPMPPKLGAWIATALASSKKQGAADRRKGAKDIERAVICEAVYIATEWLPAYSNSSRAYTAVEVVAKVLYDVLDLDYSPDQVINYWKESKSPRHRRG